MNSARMWGWVFLASALFWTAVLGSAAVIWEVWTWF